MKVKIIRCDVEGYWYSRKIGKTFTIETKENGKPLIQEENSVDYYRVIMSEAKKDKKGQMCILIEKKDCEVL